MLNKDNLILLEKQFQHAEKKLSSNEICLLKPANQWIEEARFLPPIKQLFGNYWQSGQVSILAGNTGVGKTLLAVSIADKITRSAGSFLEQKIEIHEKVLYMDFELSQRQFYKRYSNHHFSNDFIRAELNPDYTGKGTINLEYILKKMDESKANLLILDNISALSLRNTEDTQIAIDIMRGLKLLSRNGKSCLVLAHTPKIYNQEGIHVDHVAGSKYLTNFADSVFFIARSNSDFNLRYLKQTKSRDAEQIDEVLLCKIDEIDGGLDYEFFGFDDEENHLGKGLSLQRKKDLAKELREQGLTFEEIGAKLGVSSSTSERYVKG